MKRFTLLLMVCLGFMTAYAAYLKDIPVSRTQPDGTVIHCFASGDEYFNYLHDANGYTLMCHPVTGYYVYIEKRDGQLVPTDYVVGQCDPAAVGLTPYAIISPEEWMARRKAWEVPGKCPINRDGEPNHGLLNNISIFIRFSDDDEFINTFSSIDNMFNDVTENACSMINYFKAASYNAITIPTYFFPGHNGEAIISYQDTYQRSYFQPYNESTNPGGYDSDEERAEREFSLLERAVNYINANYPVSPDLDIDSNNDGYVDNVCFIVRGGVGSWSDLLWPHKWSLYDRNVYINEKRVYDFNFQLADATYYFNTSTMCHEMNHTLGAPDLYHYYYTSGPTPVGKWDLMDNNATPPQHCCAYMKMKYGHWIDEIPEITQAGTYTLNPISSSTPTNIAYKIASSSDPNQFYVLEYRDTTSYFESDLPGSGLLIYRIDTRFEGNADYDPGKGQYDEVYVFRPYGTDSNGGNINSAHFCANENRTEFSPSTTSYPFLSDGTLETSLRIYDISAADSTISFKYGTTASCDPPTNLVAMVSGRNVTLTWDTAQNAQSYNVYRDGTLIGNTTETAYLDSNLSCRTYTYYIRSLDAQELLSTGSEFAYATIDPIASNLTVVYSGGNAELSWTAPEVDSKTPLATLLPENYTYNLYDGTTQLNSEPITVTYFTHNTPANNAAHLYTVKTIYNSGETAASNMAGLTIGTATLSSLELGEDDMMTVTKGSTLTISGTLSNSVASNLVLEDGAQLINNSTDVQATVKKDIEAYTSGTKDGWYTIAIPFVSYDPANELAAGTFDLYGHDETGDNHNREWINYEAAAFSMTPGAGYLYANNTTATMAMTGTLNGGSYSQTVNLGYTNSNDDVIGYNLLGNPTAHDISFSKTNGVSDGYYYLNNGSAWTYTTAITVPIGRGFLVKANAIDQTVTLNPQSKGETVEKGHYLSVSIGDATAYVKLNEGVSMPLLDFNGCHATLYLVRDRKPYVMLVRDGANALDLCFEPSQAGTQTLTVDIQDLDLDYLHLIDNITGDNIDLLQMDEYTFEARMSDFVSRFRIVFSANDGLSTGSESFAYFNGGEWVVVNEGEATMQVIDMMGRIVALTKVNGNATFSTDNLSAGVYVMRLVNGTGVRVQKMVVR